MKYIPVKLGDEVVQASRIAMGTMNFGSTVSEELSFEMMDYYLSIGGNWFDTGHMYAAWVPDGLGKSEITLGKWIKARNNRDKVFVSTKGGFEYHETSLTASNDIPRIERDFVIPQLDDSLNRMQLDYVDLYMLHTDDPTKPVSDIVDFMDEIVKTGRARAVGVSNWTSERLDEANIYAKAAGKTPLTISQINWSLGYIELHDRFPADECHMTNAQHEYYERHKDEITVMAFCSQARAIYSRGVANGWDSMKNDVDRVRYLTSRNYHRMLKLQEICERDNCSPADVVVNYVVDDEIPSIAIIGASNMKQLKDSLSATEHNLCISDIKELASIVL